MSKDGTVLPFNLALVYLGLGDRARALDNLERALAADSQMMAWIGRDAIFDPIRSEPRFVALLKKMGLQSLSQREPRLKRSRIAPTRGETRPPPQDRNGCHGLSRSA